MRTLLWQLHLAFWRRSPVAALLPVAGVAIGVAAVLAVDLAGTSAVESFRATLERIDGRTTHRILGRDLPADLARRLAAIPGVEAAAPVVEETALFAPPQAPDDGPLARPGAVREGPAESLRLLGVDPLAEGALRSLGVDAALGGWRGLFRDFLGRPGALLVSGVFLDRHRLTSGDPLPLVVGATRRRAFVLGRLPDSAGGGEVPDNLAIGDIATVHELAGLARGVDRVDLMMTGPAVSSAEQQVRASLPSRARLGRPGGTAQRLERGLAAFRSNVQALSYLALFVSLFLIYNAMLIAVLRRRPQLAVARCLGATRGQVLAAWLVEGGLIGVLGSVLGLGLGVAFAGPALGQVAQTARDFYGAVGGARVTVASAALAKAAVLGVAFTLAATLLPALDAARTVPAHTAARSTVESSARRSRRRGLLAVGPLTIAGGLAVAWPTDEPWPGYVAAACLAVATGLLVPPAADLVLGRFLSPGRSAASLFRMAATNIRANMSRTGVALAALTLALAMSVAMGTLVTSFRHDLVEWIEASVGGDVYVSPLGLEADREDAALPPELESRLAGLPGVEAVDAYHRRPARVRDEDAYLAAVDAQTLVRESAGRWPILEGGPPRAFFAALAAGEAAVSETLHRKTGIRPGERIGVVVDGRLDSLRVTGVYRDYTTDRGIVLVDRHAYAGARELGPPRSIALYVAPGIDPEVFAAGLRATLGRELALQIRTASDIRRRALAVFGRTFAITRALEVIGIVVAAIGVLGALLALLLERTRELATLRALGATRGQLGKMFLGEATLLAGLAWLFALLAGAALGWIVIAVVNVRSFGWALDYRLPLEVWGGALVASLLAAWVATLWPLHRLSRMAVAPLLREE